VRSNQYEEKVPVNQLNQKVVKATLFGLASGVFLLAGSLTAVAGEVKYKHQLPITLSDGSQVMTYRETEYRNLAIREWAIVKVQDNKTFSVYHTTQRSRGVFQKWFDHPVKAMKVCLTNGFELSNCEVIESDTASIPEGKTIHNLSIEIIYSENGSDQRNTFNIPTEAKPE
jgi:hypothetical protein